MDAEAPSRATAAAGLEAEIRSHADASRWAEAATSAILGYGPELLGYLGALSESRALAEELFAELCERLWRKLPSFSWRSSFRTWAYAIARHIAADARRSTARRARREVPLSAAPPSAVMAAMRSTIERTAERNDHRLAQVRALLDDEERTLLVLRIERRMAWLDIARVVDTNGDDDAPDVAALERTAARLRKQFERVKERLRKGLVESTPHE